MREHTSGELFPFGINKVNLVLNLPGNVSVTIDVEGPASGSATAFSHPLRGGDHAFALAGKSIDDLDLAPHARAGAQTLLDKYGADIVFTSGRRTVGDQCRVMAQNIVSSGKRNWIALTYKNGQELQDWLDQHPDAVSVADLQAGLLSVMGSWSDAKLGTISYHLIGAAFDLAPVGGTLGTEIKNDIEKLENKNKFIDGEAGVAVWHVQFN